MTPTPRSVYEEFYCQRGEIENRIKELHHGLEIERTSCSRFFANQFRVLLTAAASVDAGTTLARGTHFTGARPGLDLSRSQLWFRPSG